MVPFSSALRSSIIYGYKAEVGSQATTLLLLLLCSPRAVATSIITSHHIIAVAALEREALLALGGAQKV